MIFRKKPGNLTLDEVLESSRRFLREGARDFRSPFHRASLTTIDGNRPEARMVILRKFSEEDRTLICHCDARSPKVSQIHNNPNVSWLFYHPGKWLQVRMSGTASVHTGDGTAESQWEKVSLPQRINYCAEAPPGTRMGRPTSGLPDFLRDRARELRDIPEARKNFAAIVCRFDEMDWLLLKLTGHIRAKFRWKDDRMEAWWVVP